MRRTREEILPGVFLTCLQTDKFKTGLISVNFLAPLSRADASQNAVIPSVLRRGTVRYPDMHALAGQLDGLYGARIEPVVRKYGEIQAVGFWADFIDDRYLPAGGARLLEDVIGLLGQIILSPATRGGLLRKDYVESEKDKLLEDIRARLNDKLAYSRTRLCQLMCAAEAYAVDVLGSEDTAEHINYVALTKRYRTLLAQSPTEIFYGGSAEPERVRQAIVQTFAVLPRGEILYDIGTDIRMNRLEDSVRVFTEQMDVAQTKLVMGFRLGECMERPDHAAIRVMNAVFGGSLSSKLFMNVRERLSLCYFASSGVDIMKGLMFVVSGVDQANCDAAIAEILRQLDEMRAGHITPEELAGSKASLMSDLMAVSDSLGQLESFWMGQQLQGLAYGPEELAALISEVSADEAAAVARSVECDMIYSMQGSGEDTADEQN